MWARARWRELLHSKRAVTQTGQPCLESMALVDGERGPPRTVLHDSLLHWLPNSGLMACPTTAVPRSRRCCG